MGLNANTRAIICLSFLSLTKIIFCDFLLSKEDFRLNFRVPTIRSEANLGDLCDIKSGLYRQIAKLSFTLARLGKAYGTAVYLVILFKVNFVSEAEF